LAAKYIRRKEVKEQKIVDVQQTIPNDISEEVKEHEIIDVQQIRQVEKEFKVRNLQEMKVACQNEGRINLLITNWEQQNEKSLKEICELLVQNREKIATCNMNCANWYNMTDDGVEKGSHANLTKKTTT